MKRARKPIYNITKNMTISSVTLQQHEFLLDNVNISQFRIVSILTFIVSGFNATAKQSRPDGRTADGFDGAVLYGVETLLVGPLGLSRDGIVVNGRS